MNPRKVLAAIFASLLVYWLMPPVEAQMIYGSILGAVSDQTNASVPGATVRITQRETNRTRTATSDDSGVFSFPTVPSGTYDIAVTKEGFQNYTAQGVTVAVDQIARVEAKLRVGNVGETVEVSSQTQQLQTESSEVRSEISTKTLLNIPVPVNRNYQSLLVTVPGFSPPDNSNSVPANPSRGMAMVVNGASRNSNNIRIDGASSNNVWLAELAAYIPGLESIETVSVVTNGFDAGLKRSMQRIRRISQIPPLTFPTCS